MNIGKLYKKYKIAVVPALGIALIVVLSLITINIAWQKISQIRAQIAVELAQKDVLDARLATLQGVTLEARESSNLMAFAMPDTSPAVLILSHLNKLAQDNEVSLDALSVTKQETPAEDTSGINSVSITFEIEGGYESIYNFTKSLSLVIPLVNLNSLEIDSEGDGVFSAQVNLLSYYAPFPTELPPLTAPLEDFTNEEKGTVNFLEGFNKPEINLLDEESLSNDSKGRENPFSEIN